MAKEANINLDITKDKLDEIFNNLFKNSLIEIVDNEHFKLTRGAYALTLMLLSDTDETIN